MNKKKLVEAIKKWNSSKTTFTSSYITIFGHSRGCKPIFDSKPNNGFIEVNIKSRPFSIDKFTLSDFDNMSEEDINRFINVVNEEITAMNNNVKDLTNTINKSILEQLTKSGKWK